MAVYSALFAMVIHWIAGTNEVSFSTFDWEFANQLNTVYTGSHDITHADIKLDLDYRDDEVHRAQNEINSERIEEYASPTICFLELDSPV